MLLCTFERFRFFKVFRALISIGALTLLLLVSGCSPHQPQAKRGMMVVPDVFVESSGVEKRSLPEKWWTVFEDEKLDTLMEELFAENLDLEKGFARLEQVRALRRSVAAARWPSLNLSGQAAREKQRTILGPQTGNFYQMSAEAAYEVDLWKKIDSRVKAARFDELATVEDIKTLYLSLSAQLADFYYLAVEQRAQLKLVGETIESFAGTLRRVERRYREGLVPAVDVYQARQNLAGAQAVKPIFRSTLAVTEHALAVLLGRFPEAEIAGALEVLPGVPEGYPDFLPGDLLGRRPDIEAAFLRLKARDERIAAAVADRLPAINLAGGAGYLKNMISSETISGSVWNLAGSVLLPVVDGGRRRAEVDRRRGEYREDLAALTSLLLDSVREVEDGLARERETRRRIVLLEKKAEATGGALRLALTRYLFGLTDYLPVLTAQGLDLDARSQLLGGRRQLIADRISLVRAMGGSWMNDEMNGRLEAYGRAADEP
jgi:NodT family efflux transporter outer membrane factor (OMF) lipoprotein